MAREQKLLFVEASKNGFVPQKEFSGSMENVFTSGWEIAQMVGLPRAGETVHHLVLLLERDLPPTTAS